MLLAATLAIALSVAVAQAAQSVPVKLEGFQVQAYTNGLVDKYQARTGQIEEVDAKGQILVSVTFLVDPQWTQQAKRMEIKREDIFLAVGGAKNPMIGFIRYDGVVTLMSRTFYASRPYKWPNTIKKLPYNLVFLAPAGTQQATLHFGDATADIKVPAKAVPMPNPASIVKAEIISIRRVPSAQRLHSVGRDKIPTIVTNPAGGLLEVKVNFSASRSNQPDNPRAFFWHTAWWGVAYDNGGASPCLGELRKDGAIHDNYSHSRFNSGGTAFNPEEVTLYFLAPPAGGGFKLLYFNQPVAQGSVGGPGASASAPMPKSSVKQPAAAQPAAPPAKESGGLKKLFKRLPGVD